MVFKRIYILLLILLWSLGSYFYLQEKYNPYTVEVYLDSAVDYSTMKEISIINRTSYHSINYLMFHEEGRLIMTAGQDNMFKPIELINGSFITDERGKTVVIGDKIANKYFRTAKVVGRKLSILGDEYLIIGIIEDSWDKYISYQENLLEEKWDQVIYKYKPDNPEHMDIRIRDMNQGLSAKDISYSHMINYKERMQDYINYMIISIIGILVILVMKPYRYFKNLVKGLWVGYQQEKRSLEWYKYIEKHKESFLKTVFLGLGALLFLASIYKLVQYIKIPQQLLPDNLFSPASYKSLVESIYSKWIQRMNIGFSNILVDTIILHLAMLLCLIIHLLVWVFYSREEADSWGEEKIEA